MHTRKTLAKRCREVRDERNLTQQEVAYRLGITQAAVSAAESYAPGDSLTGLRLRILETVGGLDLDGPYWQEREN